MRGERGASGRTSNATEAAAAQRQRAAAAAALSRTFKVDEQAVLSPPRLALANHHARHDCAASRARERGALRRCYRQSGRDTPFLRKSGFPFFTVPMNMSPGAAPGRRFRREPQPGRGLTRQLWTTPIC
jgi:hypothetical protein